MLSKNATVRTMPIEHVNNGSHDMLYVSKKWLGLLSSHLYCSFVD